MINAKFNKCVIFALLITMLQSKEIEMCISDFEVKSIDGQAISISNYKDKTLLIVNVTSKCALMPLS